MNIGVVGITTNDQNKLMETEEVVQEKDLERMKKYILNI